MRATDGVQGGPVQEGDMGAWGLVVTSLVQLLWVSDVARGAL